MLSIIGVAHDQVWYKQPSFYNSNFFIPNGLASPFRRVFLEEISSKMTSIRSRRCPRRERPFIAPSVALFVTLLDSSPPPKSGDEFSDQSAGPSGTKLPVADAPVTSTNVPKYSEDDVQRMFKAVLEAPAPTSAPVPAPVVSKVPKEKLIACSLNIYCRKSHIDCYNFCQQCENYFDTAGATGPTRILFAAFFLRDRISFRWQQYKQRYDADTPVLVTWDEFKALFWQNLGDS